MLRDLEERFRAAAPQLNERERRLWAASEARRLGRGGIALVSRAIRMSPTTIRRGLRELTLGASGGEGPLPGRIRKSGGGRKRSPAADERGPKRGRPFRGERFVEQSAG